MGWLGMGGPPLGITTRGMVTTPEKIIFGIQNPAFWCILA